MNCFLDEWMKWNEHKLKLFSRAVWASALTFRRIIVYRIYFCFSECCRYTHTHTHTLFFVLLWAWLNFCSASFFFPAQTFCSAMRIEILLCLQRNFLFIFFHYILFAIAAGSYWWPQAHEAYDLPLKHRSYATLNAVHERDRSRGI